MLRAPDHQRGAVPGHRAVLEGAALPEPGVARTRHQSAQGQPVAALRLEGSTALDPQQRMGAGRLNGTPQARTPQAAVSQHQHRQLSRDDGLELSQQLGQHGYPGATGQSMLDVPGDRDGRAAVEHADDQDNQILTVMGGVDRQGQPITLPPLQDPAEQGRKAGAHIQLGLTDFGFVVPVIEPFAQGLAGSRGAAEGAEGADDGILTGTVGQDRAQ